MKMYVAYASAGKILAAVNLSERLPENGTASHPRLILKEGQCDAEIEVPEEHNHLTFLEVCKSFSVDTSSDRPRLKPNDRTTSS
jgi:hypothetical protein